MVYSPDTDLGWSALVDRLPAGFDLAATAREAGAFMRARRVDSAESLLRLALIYGATPLSLRGAAAWAEASGAAQLSDVALLGRLQAAGPWLGQVVSALLSAVVAAPCGLARRVRLIDATTIPVTGQGGRGWRLHADYDLAAGRFAGLDLTDHQGAESLERFTPDRGDIVIGDRYYAKARQLRHVTDCGGDVVVRWGLTGCRLTHPDGRRFDVMEVLRGADGTLDVPVLVPTDRGPIRARLIVRHLGPEAAERARHRARRKAAKNGQTPTAKRLKAAEYCMLLTSLDADSLCADRVLDLYRLRWQIELAFKRLKSLAGLEDLQAKDPRLVRSCLYAKLIVALLSEDLLRKIGDSPPWAARSAAPVDMAATTSHPDGAPATHRR